MGGVTQPDAQPHKGNPGGTRMTAPPAKKVPEPLAGNEQRTSNTASAETQSHPLITLCRAWMRCDNAADRALFLGDVKAAHPDLWEQASKEGTDP
jgi:hypothetical protein